MAQTLYTFGYEGLQIETFIARLGANRVQAVFDVRAMPLSRKRGFSKRSLADALHRAGIVYAHVPALGCPKAIRDRYKADHDWAAYSEAFHGYLNTQPGAIRELARLASKGECCLVCFEADFNHCHRTYVGRATARVGGLRLMHITGRTVIPDLAAQEAA